MLTFVESISLAGDRKKQNDDACGFAGARAWVLDGATDLHDKPLSGWASDASWIAHLANAQLYGFEGRDLRETVRAVSTIAAQAFDNARNGRSFEKWQSPISSLLMIEESQDSVRGLDLGDCRIFMLDADGELHVTGGPDEALDAEIALAAKQADGDKPLLQRSATMEVLRAQRASINRPGSQWTFGIDPACADHTREWRFVLKRPAHALLMTDGFSALVDRYRVYDARGLVRAALDKGLQELGLELREIEGADAAGSAHPRFKKSDDATALLLRLT